MITGVHTILYSDDAEVTRAFLRDVVGWSAIDSGGGWLIFETPPAEMGVHPTKGEGGEVWATVPHHDVSFLCDDIEATRAELEAKGVEFTSGVQDQGYGLVTSFLVPAAGQVHLFQPRYTPPFQR
ncbi:MAG: VOC family protein [Acidimicrobiales bacterium]|nr:VOC family protein [Acidimicrobiales bacterium]